MCSCFGLAELTWNVKQKFNDTGYTISKGIFSLGQQAQRKYPTSKSSETRLFSRRLLDIFPAIAAPSTPYLQNMMAKKEVHSFYEVLCFHPFLRYLKWIQQLGGYYVYQDAPLQKIIVLFPLTQDVLWEGSPSLLSFSLSMIIFPQNTGANSAYARNKTAAHYQSQWRFSFSMERSLPISQYCCYIGIWGGRRLSRQTGSCLLPPFFMDTCL